jgi:hypothetical protein
MNPKHASKGCNRIQNTDAKKAIGQAMNKTMSQRSAKQGLDDMISFVMLVYASKVRKRRECEEDPERTREAERKDESRMEANR